jgi:HPr kinase/phosphorylase
VSSSGRESNPGAPTSPGPPGPPVVSVRSLMSDAGLGIELTLIAGEAGLDRQILHTRIQKSGLALAATTTASCLPAFRSSARRSCRSSSASAPTAAFARCAASSARPLLRDPDDRARPFDSEASGYGVLPVPELAQIAQETGTPLVLSPDRSSVTINAVHATLDDRLAPRVRLHGVLVDVFGVGLLLMGPSAVGKSEWRSI